MMCSACGEQMDVNDEGLCPGCDQLDRQQEAEDKVAAHNFHEQVDEEPTS